MKKLRLLIIFSLTIFLTACSSTKNQTINSTVGKFDGNTFYNIIKSAVESVDLQVENIYNPKQMSPCKGGYAGIDFGEQDNCETETINIPDPGSKKCTSNGIPCITDDQCLGGNCSGTKSWIAMTYYPNSNTLYTLNQLNENINNSGIRSEIISLNGKNYIEAKKMVQNQEMKMIIINCQNKAIAMFNYRPEENSTLNDINTQKITENILSKCK